MTNYFGGSNWGGNSFGSGFGGCGCNSWQTSYTPTFVPYSCGCGGSYGGGNSSYYAIILVLFILLVIVIGSRYNR